MPKPADIADPTYRQEMEDANAALNDGRYLDAVRKCADSFLGLVLSRPALLTPAPGARGAAAWPRLGVRLVIEEGKGPGMVWDRQRFAFAEAITYYEFTLEQLIRASPATPGGG